MIFLLLGLISTVDSRLFPRGAGTLVSPHNLKQEKANEDIIIDVSNGQEIKISGLGYSINGGESKPLNSNIVFALQGSAKLSDNTGKDVRLSGIKAAGAKCSLALEQKTDATKIILESFETLEINYAGNDFPKICVQSDSFVIFTTKSGAITIPQIQVLDSAEFNFSSESSITINSLLAYGTIANCKEDVKVSAIKIEVRSDSIFKNIEFITEFDVFMVHVTFVHCTFSDKLVLLLIIDGKIQPPVTLIDQEEFTCGRLEVNIREDVKDFMLIEGFDNESETFDPSSVTDLMWFYPSTNENGYEYGGYIDDFNTALYISPVKPEPVPAWIIATVILACCLAVFLVYFFVYRKKDTPEISIPIKNDQSMDPTEEISVESEHRSN